MADPILVAVAWPNANAPIHVGNLTGAYLPADIFARCRRLQNGYVHICQQAAFFRAALWCQVGQQDPIFYYGL